MKTRIFIIVLVVALILVVSISIILKSEKKRPKEISLEEKQLIESWITENDLNQYGDPKETMYTGGTPLFDEKTGKRIDKYEYILKNHPDRPWRR